MGREWCELIVGLFNNAVKATLRRAGMAGGLGWTVVDPLRSVCAGDDRGHNIEPVLAIHAVLRGVALTCS